MRNLLGILAAGLLLTATFASTAEAQFRNRGWGGYGNNWGGYGNNWGRSPGGYYSNNFYQSNSFGIPYYGANSYYTSPAYSGYQSYYNSPVYSNYNYGGYNNPYYSGYYNPGVTINTPLGGIFVR